MAATITFFPVDNGDMTLISLADANETKIMIDCNIREAADDSTDTTRDVAKDLRERLKRDSKGRPYVDVFALSHPDHDHCNGLANHFYLGPSGAYPDDQKNDSEKRIFIREIWSSPIVFRRASREHTLCEDAKAFNSEAKRRVALNKEKSFSGVREGDRILILGEDEGGKTDGLDLILIRTGQRFDRVNWIKSQCFSAQLLAPLPRGDDYEEEQLSKNHSSVVLNMSIASDRSGAGARNFLTGGDAEVGIWERLWRVHKSNSSVFAYDLLQTPHHSSWHSLSYDSWSELHEDAQISIDAVSALSQIRQGGAVVSSSAPILDDDNDPPCFGAKRIYEGIARSAAGTFHCTGEHPSASGVAPLEFAIAVSGLQLVSAKGPTERLLRSAAVSTGLGFPSKPVVPNKSSGFA